LANAGNDFVGAVDITSPNVTISDANSLTLNLLGSGAQTAVVQNATDLTMSSQATALSVDFSAVQENVAITSMNATSLNLLGSSYNGVNLDFIYTPASLGSANVTVNGLPNAYYSIGDRAVQVSESSSGGVSNHLSFQGISTNVCNLNIPGSCAQINAQLSVTPALTSVVAGAERDAQSQVAGIGQIVKRLKGNSIDMADLTASLEYKKQDVNRAPCSVEQNAGEVVTPPRTCTER
jgi:hypothetical protein